MKDPFDDSREERLRDQRAVESATKTTSEKTIASSCWRVMPNRNRPRLHAEFIEVKMLLSRILCRVAPQQLRSSRLIATTMIRREVKTPVQEWGWAYLQKQKSLGRPIAPHLGAYKPPITMIVSGLHRITGCVMATTLLLGGVGFALLPITFTDFVEYIRSWHLHPIITSAFKWVIVFPIALHVMNGIRFIGFDLAKGMKDINEIVRSGYLVLILAAVIATAAVYMAWPTAKEPEKKQ